MILTLLLASSLWALPAPGPAPCAGAAATLDDLEGCQRRALDQAAAAFAQTHGGALPSEAVLSQWQKAQFSEKNAYLKRHPEPVAKAKPEVPKSSKVLTVYVAPWCPHCRDATGLIVSLRRYLAERGVETHVIVGQDNEARCRDYARSFGEETDVDPAGEWAPPGGVPNFVVTRRDGSLVRQQPGVDPRESAEELAADLGLP